MSPRPPEPPDPVLEAAKDVIRDVEHRLWEGGEVEDGLVPVSLHHLTKLKSVLDAVEGRK